MNTSNITRTFVVILFILVAAIAANMVSAATTLEISGNSSNGSIQYNQSSTNVIDQQNSANVQNDVNANAATGGNNVNGNTGDSNVTTGDATTNVNICNNLNTNVVGGGAGSLNNPCLTPTKAKAAPTPTLKPGVGEPGPSNGGGNGGGNGGSSSGGVGGGSVQGLSTTSGENELSNMLKLLPAFGSLAFGYSLLRKNV